LAFFTITLGYFTLYQILKFPNPQINFAFWIGFEIGYLIYDLTHYSLHHIDTSKGKGGYFHNLQRYHNQHHFGGEELGFGVSSKFWDIIFRTEMTKRKVH
jgi:4-hydroxysphinganine ceramide fatty acyl 2-hydroxylase